PTPARSALPLHDALPISAREEALAGTEAKSPLMGRPYDLRHAAVSTWLNAGVPAAQVAEWAGHSTDVLLRVYVKCIAGQQGEAKDRKSTRLNSSHEWISY